MARKKQTAAKSLQGCGCAMGCLGMLMALAAMAALAVLFI